MSNTGRMRDEREVLALLQSWAHETPAVRTIILEGSRADPRRTPDALSDYDVAVYVDDSQPFVEDESWLDRFGPILVRWPRSPRPTAGPEWVTQLVLFDDGVRIDFQITDRPEIDAAALDAGYRVLFDRSGAADCLPESTGTRHLTKPPAEAEYADTLNAFWWDITYVAKGLARGELPFAKAMLDGIVRTEIVGRIVAWYIGAQYDWSVDVGVHNRWMHRYLSATDWDHYRRTLAGAEPRANWKALFETTAFVRTAGSRVAHALGFAYPWETDRKVTAWIEAVRGGQS